MKNARKAARKRSCEKLVFVDSNVLIGAFAKDAENVTGDAKCLQMLFARPGVRLCTSSVCVMHLITRLQKPLGYDAMVRIVKALPAKFTIIACTGNDIEAATGITGRDLEDNVQYVLARKMKCAHFVTNNAKDYQGFASIAVYTPNMIGNIS